MVMTIIGKDRPGLVDLVAGTVVQHGGNWLESRMSRLGGHFAGILRVEVEAEKESALVQALAALERQGLSVVVHTDRETPPTQAAPTLAQLEIVGQDRPGIVRQISQSLVRYGVNVEELHTECSSAPMSGEALFKAEAKLRLPQSCQVAALQADLERIAGNLMVDIHFEPLTG